MRRREFIGLVGGTAVWPLAAMAQKKDGLRRVGIIMGFAENDGVWQSYLATFREALQTHGWTDGRNIRFDYRFTGESEERMRRMAAEIVGLAPDVILTSTNSVVSATLDATRSIPVVFTWVSDPVRSGFVTNLPHPGGKSYGLSQFRAGNRRKVACLSRPDRSRAAPCCCLARSGNCSKRSVSARH
jgi:putative ABC transport system substrate-binding protein